MALDFNTGNLPEMALLESFGMKSKRTSLIYAKEHEHLNRNLLCGMATINCVTSDSHSMHSFT